MLSPVISGMCPSGSSRLYSEWGQSLSSLSPQHYRPIDSIVLCVHQFLEATYVKNQVVLTLDLDIWRQIVNFAS